LSGSWARRCGDRRCRGGGRSWARGERVGYGLAPGWGAEGVDVFGFGEFESLDDGLAEVGEGGGGFGFDVAVGYGGEEAGESGGQVAGGNVVAGEEGGDVLAGLFAG
jgi:hypothetical protein